MFTKLVQLFVIKNATVLPQLREEKNQNFHGSNSVEQVFLVWAETVRFWILNLVLSIDKLAMKGWNVLNDKSFEINGYFIL